MSLSIIKTGRGTLVVQNRRQKWKERNEMRKNDNFEAIEGVMLTGHKERTDHERFLPHASDSCRIPSTGGSVG